MVMLSYALLMTCPFLMLRITGNGSFPKPLTSDEEKEYIEKYIAGDMEARNVLIERNLRLVTHIIKKYYTQADNQEDLISIGTIGLIKGISTYKPDKGVRLATYASRCIENEILMFFRSSKKSAGELSLSDSINTDKEGNSLSLIDIISVDDNMLEEVSTEEMCREVVKYIDQVLDEREKEIIYMRYGLGGIKPITQREIASKCGISRSYVSRIEKKALEKLRKCFEDE